MNGQRLDSHRPLDIASLALHAGTSACPGLLRIVQARDGGICRIRLACGRLSIAQARAIADVAEQHGNGIVEITNRANLQLRGLDVARSEAPVAALLAAGLGPAEPGGDDVRNVLVSPTAGIDVDLHFDTTPLAMRILELLQARVAWRHLSPKFALALDGGERAMAVEHPHDLWLAACSRDELAFGLAGCAPLRPGDAPALAAVPRRHVSDLVAAVIDLFLECAAPGQTRMRDVLAQLPAPQFLQRLQARLPFVLRADAALAQWRRAMPARAAHIGAHAQRDAALHYVGAVPPLGRIDAPLLRELAAQAEALDADLRMTPWQGVLLANVAAVDAPRLVAHLQRAGLSCSADDVVSHMLACSGNGGCAKGRADTKGDALQLAHLLERELRGRIAGPLPSLHLTGCERSCATPQRADFTLLATAPGRYAVYRRAAERADFGHALAQSIDIDAAAALIAAHFTETDA